LVPNVFDKHKITAHIVVVVVVVVVGLVRPAEL
jgi:hypothetical protein